jgi:prepilin-type N-terminal cleavage/methylation domain-containing protein
MTGHKLKNRKAFSLLEVAVVLAILVVIIAVAFHKFKEDRHRQIREVSRVDRQQSMRRFLMWFRQDMQSLDILHRYQVLRSFQPLEDGRLIEVAFDRYVEENTKELVVYRFDPNQRRLSRVVQGKQAMTMDNIVSFQLQAFDFASQRLFTIEDPRQLYFFVAILVFSEDKNYENPASFREIRLSIYPRLKSSWNKAGFNRFNLNPRFE